VENTILAKLLQNTELALLAADAYQAFFFKREILVLGLRNYFV
jgi:hypothetical protein